MVSDNLVAHDLAGFSKSFRAEYFCRFCTATQAKLQTHEVASGEFSLRTKDIHNSDVHGVQADCVLSQHLEHFHTVTGFPPDVHCNKKSVFFTVKYWQLWLPEFYRKKYGDHV